MTSLHRNSVWIMSAIIVTSGLGYVYWAAVAHLFAAPQIGLATALVSLMTVTAIVANLGTAPALIQRLPMRDGIEEWSTTFSASLIGGGAIGALAGLAVVEVVPLLSHSLSVARSDLAIAALFVAGTTFWAISLVLDYTFIAERRSVAMSVRGAVFATVKIPLVIAPALLVAGSRNATLIFGSWVLAVGISCLAGVVVMIPALRPGFRIRLAGTASELRAIARLLAGNHLITLGNSLPLYLLPVIVVTRLSTNANAYFYITWMVGGLFFMISSSVGTSLFAEGSSHPDHLGASVRSATRLTVLLLVPAMLIVLLAGHTILSLFGAAYAAHGTDLLWVLTIAAVPDAITNLYVPVLRVRGRLRPAACLTMGMATVALVGAWIVAPSLKLVGIGVVWLCSQALGSVWVAWDTRHVRARRRGRSVESRPSEEPSRASSGA